MKFFTLEDWSRTPSRNHKISGVFEQQHRAKAISFILRTGTQLKLKYTTICSACIFFHEFYFRRSFSVHDKYDIACACIHFACKCEEDRRRLADVIETCYYFKYWKKAPNPKTNKKESERLINTIKDKELLLLQTLEFDFCVAQPFDYLPFILAHWKSKYCLNHKHKNNNNNMDGSPITKHYSFAIIQFYFQVAWYFVLDALKLFEIVVHCPEHIAIACVELALRYVNLAFHERQKQKESSSTTTTDYFDGNTDDDDDAEHAAACARERERDAILPRDIFPDQSCVMDVPNDWFDEFEPNLHLNVLQYLCSRVIEFSDFERISPKEQRLLNASNHHNSNAGGGGGGAHSSAMQTNNNAFFVDKRLLKQWRHPVEDAVIEESQCKNISMSVDNASAANHMNQVPQHIQTNDNDNHSTSGRKTKYEYKHT